MPRVLYWCYGVLAHLARALRWQRRGEEFESPVLHQDKISLTLCQDYFIIGVNIELKLGPEFVIRPVRRTTARITVLLYSTIQVKIGYFGEFSSLVRP